MAFYGFCHWINYDSLAIIVPFLSRILFQCLPNLSHLNMIHPCLECMEQRVKAPSDFVGGIWRIILSMKQVAKVIHNIFFWSMFYFNQYLLTINRQITENTIVSRFPHSPTSMQKLWFIKQVIEMGTSFHEFLQESNRIKNCPMLEVRTLSKAWHSLKQGPTSYDY